MSEKRLYEFSLTFLDILLIEYLKNQGKKCILIGDNKFKVIDDE